MAEVPGVLASVVTAVQVVLTTVSATASLIGYGFYVGTISGDAFLVRYYGISGLWLAVFGSKDILRSELQVLGSDGEQVASDFKKATQDESNMIAVAGTILAQIAITALSLVDLSNTHWTAQGLFSFSLVSSIIAVYYASNQHRTMGRCLNSAQVKAWIENYNEAELNDEQLRKPAASSILTISAPTILLSASLNSFLAGFGVYLGFTWIKNLDERAGAGDSRNVFLVYAIGLGVCYGIYALSGLISRGRTTSGINLEELLVQANAPRSDRPETSHFQPRSAGEQYRMTSFTTDRDILVEALQDAATSQEQSAEASRRVAEIYRQLSEQVPANDRPHRRRASSRRQG